MSSAEHAPSRTDTSPPVRLAKGEIPSTWSRPAEQVTQLPLRAPRPLTSAFIVVGGAVVGFVLAVWLSPARSPQTPTAPQPPPPVAVAAQISQAAPMPVSAIPVPPPTSSTKPADVAPEDQGGELAAPPAPVEAAAPPAQGAAPPVAAVPTATTTTTGAPPASAAVVGAGDAPGRAKAALETARARALVDKGLTASAEAPLIRATLGDPSFAEAWSLLGRVRAELGNAEGARRAYKRYLQLAPGAPDVHEVRAALAALARPAPPPAPALAPAAAPAPASEGAAPPAPDPAGN